MAPAEVFQAAAFTPTERRLGTMTPYPPNAATDRTIAPRFLGSVMPSRATKTGAESPASAFSASSSGWA